MLTKLERVAFEERHDASLPRHDVLSSEPDAIHPTAREVFREMAATIAAFLAVALAANLLVAILGV